MLNKIIKTIIQPSLGEGLVRLFLLFCLPLLVSAQSPSQKFKQFLTEPYGYVAYRTSNPITVDGILDEADWKNAPSTEEFRDISGEGFPIPKYKTSAKVLWDDNYLYIGGTIEEPNVWANLTKRDTVVFYDPDFEVFIDPDNDGHNYYEIETNAKGLIFDLFLREPYRSPRRAYVTFSWNSPGMLLKTHVDGTLNDARDQDKGWTVEIAIPREAIAAEFDNYLKAGNYLRVGFSRVEWQTTTDTNGITSRKKDSNGKFLPEDNWTWPSTGQIAMHMPERWGYIFLSPKTIKERQKEELKTNEPNSGKGEFKYPSTHYTDKLLWTMFYIQEKYFEKAHKYYSNLTQFGLTSSELKWLPKGAKIVVEAMKNHYEIRIVTAKGYTSINEEGRIWRNQ